VPPKYAEIALGFMDTALGVPSAIIEPSLRQISRSANGKRKSIVWSTISIEIPALARLLIAVLKNF
jgi:hypothetical protein